MENSKENIDKLFGEGLGNFEQETPHDAWGNINSRLDKANRKKKMAYWRWSSLILLISLSFAGGYYFNDLVKPSEPEVLSKQAISPTEPISSVNVLESKSNESQVKFTTKDRPGLDENKVHDFSRSSTLAKDEINLDKAQSEVLSSSNNRRKKDLAKPSSKGPSITLASSAQSNNFKPGEEPIVAKNQSLLNLQPKLLVESVVLDESANTQENFISRTEDLGSEERIYNPLVSPFGKDFFSNIELSAIAGYSFPFRTVVFDASDPIAENNVNNEQLANTFTYGLRLSKRWKFLEYHIGIFQSSWKQTSNNVIVEGEPVNNSLTTYTDMVAGITSYGNVTFGGSSGPPVLPTKESGRFFLLPNIIQEYQFIDIPVGVSYIFLDRRLQLKFNFGINNKILSGSAVQLDFPNGVREDHDGLVPNRYSMQLLGGPSLALKLSRQWKWQLEPTVNYGISPISNSNGVKTYMHQFSILSGISYSF